MKARALSILALGALLLCGCFDLDAAYKTCTTPGGRCTFAFSTQKDASVDAGMRDGGQAVCSGCFVNGECMSGTARLACGGGGEECKDCALHEVCGGASGCQVSASWRLLYTAPGRQTVHAVAPISLDDAWFGSAFFGVEGVDSHLIQYRSTGFTEVAMPGRLVSVIAVGAPGSAKVYVLRLGTPLAGPTITVISEPWDGGAQPENDVVVPSEIRLLSLFAAGSEVFGWAEIGSSAFNIIRIDPTDAGIGLTVVTPPGDPGFTQIHSASGTSAGDLWVAGGRNEGGGGIATLAHFHDGGVRSFPLLSYSFGLWARNPNAAVYVAGEIRLFARVDDAGVHELGPMYGLTGETWSRVWGVDDRAVFAVGSTFACDGGGTVRSYNGLSLADTCVGDARLTSVGGTSASDVWAGSTDGGLYRLSSN